MKTQRVRESDIVKSSEIGEQIATYAHAEKHGLDYICSRKRVWDAEGEKREVAKYHFAPPHTRARRHTHKYPPAPQQWHTGQTQTRLKERLPFPTPPRHASSTFLELVPIVTLLLPHEHESYVSCTYFPRAFVRVDAPKEVENQLIVLCLERKVGLGDLHNV